MKKNCQAEAVIKTCLKIAVNLLHEGKHAVDKAKQTLLSCYEHQMYYDWLLSHWPYPMNRVNGNAVIDGRGESTALGI